MKSSVISGMNTMRGAGLNLLSQDDLYEIHMATMEVMRRTGVKVENDEAIDIFDGGGCIVDRKRQLVKFPSHVVEDAIRSAPDTILLAGRSPKDDVVIGGKRIAFTNFGQAIMIIDPFTGERRETTKKDIANIVLVCDALSEVSVIEGKPLVPNDVTSELESLHAAEAALTNTSKHCFGGPITKELTKLFVEMSAIIAGSKEKAKERPIWTAFVCPSSPLGLSQSCSEVIIEAASAGMPINVLSMAMAGGTTTVTLAGTLIGHNAEVLAGIVLSQLVCKGAPVIYGSSTTIMDLKSATAPVGCPEFGLISAAAAQLAQYYHLPSYVGGT